MTVARVNSCVHLIMRDVRIVWAEGLISAALQQHVLFISHLSRGLNVGRIAAAHVISCVHLVMRDSLNVGAQQGLASVA